MGEVQAADARAGPHGAAFGQLNAGVLFSVEQLPSVHFSVWSGQAG